MVKGQRWTRDDTEGRDTDRSHHGDRSPLAVARVYMPSALALASRQEGVWTAKDEPLSVVKAAEKQATARRALFRAAQALRDGVANAVRRQNLAATAVSEWESAVAEAERCAEALKQTLVGKVAL